MTVQPDLETFRQRAKKGNLVPVYQEVLADLDTPVSVYRKLENSQYSFLLDSVEGGEQIGRYSFLGADPFLVFRSRKEEQELEFFENARPFEKKETPIETLRHIMDQYHPVPDPNLPPFIGGAVGFMSYDSVRYFENIPDNNPDEMNLPDSFFLFADTVIAFDHVKHRMLLITNAYIDGDADKSYEAAKTRLSALRRRILSSSNGQDIKERESAELTTRSNFKKEEFESIVSKAKEYIAAGDIFQVVLSQRFSADITCSPLDVYRALRAVNPSPYMFFLKCGETCLAGSSPEILVRCQDNKVTVRPIAGTRPRGATPAEDKAYEADLLEDEKERAEHVMLVDLGRNDIGRVCRFGTVHVTDFMVIERYSHVMHIVSNVEGELQEGCDAVDVLAACFPAGTVSGAPKIRAMEIIDELENTRRGPYAGSVVYFGFNGSMDSAITIRTAVISNGVASVQAGAGIVADSVPENEWQETVNKAQGMLRAIEWAESGLEG